MQTATKNKKRRASNTRENIREGAKRQSGISGIGISGGIRRRSPGSSTSGESFSNLLGKELKPASCFKADLREFDSEKLLQIIPQIHECLLNVPDYEDKKEWDSIPSLVELADHLIKEVRRVTPKDYYWIIMEDDGVLELKYMQHVKGLDGYNAIPCEWLPALQAQNEELHNIVLGTMYYVARKTSSDIIITNFDDYYIDDPGMREVDDGELDVIIESDVAKYKKGGIAQQYLKNMKDFFSLYGVEDLIDMIINFKPKGELQKDIKLWLGIGISVLRDPADLDDYIIENPEEYNEDGNPLTIKDGINFPWSFYDSVARNTEEWKDSHYSEWGMKDGGVFGVFSKEGHKTPEPINKIKNLLAFMEAGRKVYIKHYDKNIKKYYDQRRNDEAI